MIKNPRCSKVQDGFTLVELLIVVIILAILAAIVVPQFASSTDDAKVSALDNNLANVRAAVDLYYQQHGEYPGQKTAVSGGTCTATKGAGTGGAGATGVAAFKEQLSMYTDADGKACSKKENEFVFGPYVKKAELPANPITNVSTLAVVNAGDLNMTGASPAAGWKFDILTGKFIADDSVNTDTAGNTYDTH